MESKLIVSKWEHRLPKERFAQIVKEFGIPNFVVNLPGGLAVWYKRNVYRELILRDESIEHNGTHCDFLYGVIDFYVPIEDLMNILLLTKSIYYDRLKQQITARCDNMPAVAVTLYLATSIVEGVYEPEQAKEMYSNLIREAQMDKMIYQDITSKLRGLIIQNRKRFPENTPNWDCDI